MYIILSPPLDSVDFVHRAEGRVTSAACQVELGWCWGWNVTSLISEMSHSTSPAPLKDGAVVRLVKTSGFASGIEGNWRFIKPVRRGAGGNPPWRGSSPCSWWDRFIFHILSDHRTSMIMWGERGMTDSSGKSRVEMKGRTEGRSMQSSGQDDQRGKDKQKC